MKKSKFSESQIFVILQVADQGVKTVSELCRHHGISQATFYNWKSKFAGMSASDIKRLKVLEEENARLKRLYAERCLEIEALKDVLSKKW